MHMKQMKVTPSTQSQLFLSLSDLLELDLADHLDFRTLNILIRFQWCLKTSPLLPVGLILH